MAPLHGPSHKDSVAYDEISCPDDSETPPSFSSSRTRGLAKLGRSGLLAVALGAIGALAIVAPVASWLRRPGGTFQEGDILNLYQGKKKLRATWRITNGNQTSYPQVQLSFGGHFAPFQLRGFDYSPVGRCCGNNDASAFQRAVYTQDIPRMAAVGANAIKLYGMCDGVLDAANMCGPPEPGCERQKVTVEDVFAFLDFCFDHKIFVLLASRSGVGDVAAYAHIASTYGGHPAVAGAILFDETLDLPSFNAAAKALHEGFCKVFGKDPKVTAVENCGRIITTAAQMQIPQKDFQAKYGTYVNSWGFDPYAELSYSTELRPFSGLPYKPYFLMESGINGAGNGGCRDDCPPCPACNLQACRCIPCTCYAQPWREYVQWLSRAPIAGVFVFEWSDENWKGGVAVVGQNGVSAGIQDADSNAFCAEMTRAASEGPGFHEANHGLFRRGPDGTSLVAKSLGEGETFESVLQSFWTEEAPGPQGFRGWLRPGTWVEDSMPVHVRQ